MKKILIITILTLTAFSLYAKYEDIKGSSIQELRLTFQAEYNRAQENLKKAIKVSEKYPQDPRPKEKIKLWQDYINKISNDYFSCPAHGTTICSGCITREEKCKACDGKGVWGFWSWTCPLCKGTTNGFSPGKTYCPKCKGLWDNGFNCKKCNETGLVSCPLGCVNGQKKCPVCNTLDGKIQGKSLLE